MKILTVFLADEANVSQEGKLNVLGIFDRIAGTAFPLVHPRMVLVFRLQTEYADVGRTFPVRVKLTDEDGDVLFEANGEINAPPVAPGDFATANQLLALVGVELSAPGRYTFAVEAEDVARSEMIFSVAAAGMQAN